MHQELSIEISDNGSVHAIPAEIEYAEQAQQEIQPLQNVFGLGFPQPQELTQMREVWEQLSKNHTVSEAIAKVREIERKLGRPKVGQTRLDRVWNYLRLQQHVRDAQSAKRAYQEAINEGLD